MITSEKMFDLWEKREAMIPRASPTLCVADQAKLVIFR
jgi:hypothetical protein